MTETVARLRISLNDTDPEVWRLVYVPLAASIKVLHDIVQAAMGWEDYHHGISRPATAATACQTQSGPTTISPPPGTSSSAR